MQNGSWSYQTCICYLHMLTKESTTSQENGSRDFWQISNSVLNKGKSSIPPLFNRPEVLTFPSDKAKLFAKNFSKNCHLDDSGNSLPVFPSNFRLRTNLKLHNISITLKMARKVISNLDSSKASRVGCIPVAVLKNCEPELSYILAELFDMCLKESCFPGCWKGSWVVLVFRNVGERSTAKNYHHVSLLSVASKEFRMLDFSTNLSLMEFLVRYLALFLLFSIIGGFRWFWMGNLLKNIQLMLESYFFFSQ